MDGVFGRLATVIHRKGRQAIAKLSEVKQCQDRNVMRPTQSQAEQCQQPIAHRMPASKTRGHSSFHMLPATTKPPMVGGSRVAAMVEPYRLDATIKRIRASDGTASKREK